MDTSTTPLPNCKESAASIIDNEVAEWLRISEQVEKAEAAAIKKAEAAKKREEAAAEAKAIWEWYEFHSTPGAQMHYRKHREKEEKIAEERSKRIAEWYKKERLTAQGRE